MISWTAVNIGIRFPQHLSAEQHRAPAGRALKGVSLTRRKTQGGNFGHNQDRLSNFTAAHVLATGIGQPHRSPIDRPPMCYRTRTMTIPALCASFEASVGKNKRLKKTPTGSPVEPSMEDLPFVRVTRRRTMCFVIGLVVAIA
jgi:hypothetical protein